ncbi:hypothetical protein NA57DRAFT_61320 [Rhizodiscina lignyota]|uniref:Uncharacterized protein n=1 Tax=Rhizodiscina lignyota TaxID=1504668 RepID=A0A9P4M1I9_9PEZI|nr:hypothetical protein NA57DRAFT_61320 [Rhizodiscina lignyota]
MLLLLLLCSSSHLQTLSSIVQPPSPFQASISPLSCKIIYLTRPRKQELQKRHGDIQLSATPLSNARFSANQADRPDTNSSALRIHTRAMATQSLFFRRLPIELREQVYDLVISDDLPLKKRELHKGHTTASVFTLLAVSYQLRTEALQVLRFRKPVFTISAINIHDLLAMLGPERSVVERLTLSFVMIPGDFNMEEHMRKHMLCVLRTCAELRSLEHVKELTILTCGASLLLLEAMVRREGQFTLNKDLGHFDKVTIELDDRNWRRFTFASTNVGKIDTQLGLKKLTQLLTELGVGVIEYGERMAASDLTGVITS